MEKDTDFIQGKRIESYNGVSFIVKKNTECREYSPDRFIDLILECYYLACDEKENAKDKLLCLINAKATIDRYLNEYNLNVHHDFSRILLDLKSQTEKYKTILEYNLDAGNSKKRFQKPIKTFPSYFEQNKIFADKLKDEFATEKGKNIKLVIEALKELGLIKLESRGFKDFYESMTQYFKRDICTYQSINDFKDGNTDAYKSDYEIIKNRVKGIQSDFKIAI